MATRQKTVEFAYPFSNTSVASGNNRDFTSINLYIPENIGVSKTIDSTSATGNIITFTTDHGLRIGNRLVPSSTGGGLTSGTTYWVKSVPSTTTITVSASFDGATSTLTNSTTDINCTIYDIVFKNAFLEVSSVDNAATAANVTDVTLGLTLGAIAIGTFSNTSVLTNSGEHQSWTFICDFRNYFNQNWTANATTMASTARINLTGLATNNTSAKIVITYEYEDSVATTTRIKTVKIPIDGNTGNLTTTASNIGAANQVPNLSTFLPEASKTFRNIFFESYSHMGNTGTGNTTNATCTLTFSGTDAASLAYNMALSTDRSFKRIDEITSILATNATSSITARVSNVTSITMPCMCGVLVVTYEYDHSSSTSIINSLEIPFGSSESTSGRSGLIGNNFVVDFFIQEPTTISLVQSGLLMSTMDGAALSLVMAVGSQADRTYTHAGGGNRVGSFVIGRRIDSGETGSTAGITLSRGLNTLIIEAKPSVGTDSVTGVVFLNYTSGKHSDGDGAHNHTVKFTTIDYSNSISTSTLSSTFTPVSPFGSSLGTVSEDIPETNYFLTNSGLDLYTITGSTVSQFPFYITTLGLLQDGTNSTALRTLVDINYYNSDAEAGTIYSWYNTTNFWKQYPTDIRQPRFALGQDNRIYYNQKFVLNIGNFMNTNLTYHTISYTISGTISGSNGGTVNIEAYRTDNGEKIASTSRTGNGSYSMTWYDNTIPVFVFAYESSTYKGVSVEQVAGNTFDVSLASGGGGGPTYYSYL